MPCCLIEGDEVALVVSIHAISSSSFYKRCADRSFPHKTILMFYYSNMETNGPKLIDADTLKKINSYLHNVYKSRMTI